MFNIPAWAYVLLEQVLDLSLFSCVAFIFRLRAQKKSNYYYLISDEFGNEGEPSHPEDNHEDNHEEKHEDKSESEDAVEMEEHKSESEEHDDDDKPDIHETDDDDEHEGVY